MYSIAALLCLLVATSAAASVRHLQQEEQQCPPPGFTTASDLDALEYIAAPWYSIKQTPVFYQRPDSLYCVQATYDLKESNGNFLCYILGNCGKRRIRVFNQARRGGVDGERIDATLQGIFSNENDGSRLEVGPTWLQGLFYGDYFIVAAGRYTEFGITGLIESVNGNAYDWAIISGGPPDTKSNGACLPGDGFFNFDGFWLFARDRSPPEGVVEGMEELAASLGYDTSALLPVVQEGC